MAEGVVGDAISPQNRDRGYIYTVWAKTDADIRQLLLDSGRVTYAAGQVERSPSTQRLHWQLYVEYKTTTSGGALRRILGIGSGDYRGFRRRGTPAQCRDYCVKEDTRVGNTFTLGELPVGQGARTDLRAAVGAIVQGTRIGEFAQQHPDIYVKYNRGIEALAARIRKRPRGRVAKSIILLKGETGTGKTSWAEDNFPDLWRAPSNFSDKAYWYDGYEGEHAVLFDDFDGNLDYRVLLRLLDCYAETVPVKGSHVCFDPRVVILTSNKWPDEWYPVRQDGCPELKRRFTDYGTIYDLDTGGKPGPWFGDGRPGGLLPELQLGRLEPGSPAPVGEITFDDLLGPVTDIDLELD